MKNKGKQILGVIIVCLGVQAQAEEAPRVDHNRQTTKGYHSQSPGCTRCHIPPPKDDSQ